ncbi:transposase-like protein [Asaia bogorensis NBRC 16594]|nr:transposase-like protein [Asaia bogorensis NBRC 16594]
MLKKPPIDWGQIAAACREGTRSTRQIARQFGIPESTLRKRIKTEGWHAPKQPRRCAAPSNRAVAHKSDALDAAQGDAAAIETRMLRLVDHLTKELEETTAQHDAIIEAIETETADDASPRRRAAMLKAVSHATRSSTLKTLAQAAALLGEKAAGKPGKKAQQKAAAEVASTGRFSPMRAPKLVVDNGT